MPAKLTKFAYCTTWTHKWVQWFHGFCNPCIPAMFGLQALAGVGTRKAGQNRPENLRAGLRTQGGRRLAEPRFERLIRGFLQTR
jgi:hypothetical protein